MDTSNKTIMKPKHRFIRLNEVMSRTGYGRTSIYRKMEDGSFPKSIKLGGAPTDPCKFDCRAIAWIEDEVDQWVDARIEARNIGLKNTPTNRKF